MFINNLWNKVLQQNLFMFKIMKREEQYCLSSMHPTLILEIIRMD